MNGGSANHGREGLKERDVTDGLVSMATITSDVQYRVFAHASGVERTDGILGPAISLGTTFQGHSRICQHFTVN
jgi:hypothetical protein